ncbi:MAG: CotH kinase family protein [Bacteroidaceae bacterium]|nr:CotH kinase family protein [Bacteroidaceae bacterium]
MNIIKNRKNVVLIAVLFAISTFSAMAQNAGGSMAEQLGFVNLDFADSSCWVNTNIRTYQKDIVDDEVYGLQEVKGWTIQKGGEATAGGTFPYATPYYMASQGLALPTKGPDGKAEGGMMGVVACWDATAQYTQPVTLPAGFYTFTFYVYNNAGTTEIVKNLIGFITDSGKEYLASSLTYPVKEWTTETISFILPQETSGYLSIGFKSVNKGSPYMPKLFIDRVEVEADTNLVYVDGISLSTNSLSLVSGDEVAVEAFVSPDNATVKTVSWSSSDESVASVDANGVVKAHSIGTATITATADGGKGIYATIEVEVKKNEKLAAAFVINEIQTANIDMYIDKAFCYGGWIEIYNSTDHSAYLGGMYLSEDRNNLKQWRIPNDYGSIAPKSFKIISFDHNNDNGDAVDGYFGPTAYMQANFKLNYDGGEIFISDEDGNLITEMEYPVAIPRTSFARTTDGGNDWGYTATPTREASNNGQTYLGVDDRLAAPEITPNGQFFTGTLSINMSYPAGTTLMYTTDGSTPTLTNGYKANGNRINIKNTQTYRFRLFADGKLPSPVVTRSYIYKDRNYYMPILSVVTDNANLYDNEIGVYTRGTNGRSGLGQGSPCNWNMDWDRPVNVEFIDEEGNTLINQESDFAMCGGWSRGWTPHSFKLKADKLYEGKNSFDAPIFDSKPYIKSRVLQVRNGGNDNSCRIIDASIQEIIRRSGIYVDCQAWRPVHNFVNGQYMGMLNIREPNNKSFAYSNYGIDTDSLDQFELAGGFIMKTGTMDAYNQWKTLSAKCADDEIYDQICEIVDIDEYINYMAIECYLGGNDWVNNNNNTKGFRANDGKFHFVIFDLDQVFSDNNLLANMSSYSGNSVAQIFVNMMKNKRFCKQFTDAYCLVAGSVFEQNRSYEIVQEMANYIESALQLENKSPWGSANNVKNNLTTNRANTMISKLKSYSPLGLAGKTSQKIKLSANIDEARLSLNDLPIPTNKFNGTLFAPIHVKAEAPAGYEFAGWYIQGASKETTIFPMDDTWKYYDQGSLDGKNWQTETYYDTSWKSGKAALGYAGDYTINTTISYGSDGNNKRPTYYFRKKFTISDNFRDANTVTLNYNVDDGFIIYVNGKEAGRYLMPSGTVSYNSYASTYNQQPEGSMTLDKSLFRVGSNVIAVEVHNNSATSSDIRWNASLTFTSNSSRDDLFSADEEIDIPSGNYTLCAVYDPLSDAEMLALNSKPIMINEVSAGNSIYVNEYFKRNDWIELYNTTDEPIDVAGMYISDKVSKPQKYQIPSGDSNISTVVPAHGFLVVWADKLDPLNQIHTAFNLANEDGEAVVITSADGEWADTLIYNAHTGVQTVGRYPDGAGPVYIFNRPTIGSSNMMDTFAQFLMDTTDHTAPIDASIHGVKAEGDVVRTEYFTTSGVRIGQPLHGVYIVRYTYRNGSVITKKIFEK